MTAAVARISSNAMSALLTAWSDARRRRQEDQRELRREAADDILSRLPELRDLLVRLERGQDGWAWSPCMAGIYRSIRRTKELTPTGWRHLHQSVFDAIGNGAGSVVWIDFDATVARGDLTFDDRWTINAIDYLDHLQSAVQRWRHAYSRKEASRIVLLSYNDWLLRTRRWSPDE